MVTPKEVKVTEENAITLKDGRQVVLRKPLTSAICRLSDILGNSPDRTFNIYMPLLWIYSINGQVKNFANRKEMDFLLDDLGDGYGEIVEGIVGLGSDKESEVSAAKK